MSKKKTVLIYGISSFLGSNLAEILKNDYKVVGTYYNTPVNIPGVLAIKCDVHNKQMVQKVAYLFQADITIYTIGLTKLDDCQEHHKVADALNTAGVFNVSQSSERYNSKFVYFSSCYIFSGEDVLYRENDTPTPLSVYGNTVASAEFYIQKSCLNYIIFRCAPIFGRGYHPMDLNFVEALERNEFLNQRISCDSKVYTGFVDVHTVAEILKLAIEKNTTNRLLQLTTSDIMTRYDFAKLYLEKFGGNSGLLAKGDWKFPRTENLLAVQQMGEELKFSMDTMNLENEYNYKVLSISETIDKYKTKISGKIRTRGKVKTSGVSFI